MGKLEQIHQLQFLAEQLYQEMESVQDDSRNVYTVISEKKISTNMLSETYLEHLLSIQKLQETLGEQYQSLGMKKTLPCALDEFNEELKVCEKQLQKQEKYAYVTDWFMKLSSEDKDVAAILEKHRENLQAMNVGRLSETECEKELEKYLHLKQAWEEEERTTLVWHCVKLVEDFEDQLVSAVIFKTLSSSQDESKLGKKVLDQGLVSSGYVGDAAYVKSDEWPQMPVSDEVLDKRAEHMSDHKAAMAEVAATVAESFEVPEERDKVSTENGDRLLLRLEEADLLVEENPDLLTTEILPKAQKKFGVKEFKNDLAKNNEVINQRIILNIDEYSAANPELVCAQLKTLKSLSNVSLEQVEICCESLLRNGYLKKYILQDIGEFYGFSTKGERIFESKDASAHFNKKIHKNNVFQSEATTNAALCKMLIVKAMTMEYQEKEWVSQNLISYRNSGVYAFVLQFNLVEAQETPPSYHTYLGIIAQQNADLEEYYQMLAKSILNSQKVMILGLNLEKSKQLANILTDEFEQLQICTLQCYGLIDDQQETIFTQTEKVKSEDIQAEVSEQERKGVLQESAGCDDIVQVDSGEGTQVAKEQDDVVQVASDEGAQVTKKEDDIIQENSDEVIQTSEESENMALEERKAVAEDNKEGIDVQFETVLQLEEQEIEDIVQKCQQMIVADKVYCATAYLYELSRKDDAYLSLYRKLAYAVNDPLEKCNYNSDEIFQIYPGENTIFFEYCIVSSTLRNYFLNDVMYDYSIKSLYDMIKECSILKNNHVLQNIVYQIMEFKNTIHSGMDRYADYRRKSYEAGERAVTKAKKNAQECCQANIEVESASNRRFLETQKIIFDEEGDLFQYLQVAIQDERELLEAMTEYLREQFIKPEMSVKKENIDMDKVERLINSSWKLAAKKLNDAKATSDLMSSLRNNIKSKVKRSVGALCDWIDAVSYTGIYKDDAGLTTYMQMRDNLLRDIEQVVQTIDIELSRSSVNCLDECAGKKILRRTLEELRERISGEYTIGEEKYFYVNFLKNDKVLLNQDYLPYADLVSYELPKLSFLKCIEEHTNAVEVSFEERLHAIFEEGEENYGLADLICQYVQSVQGVNLLEKYSYNLEEFIQYAQTAMPLKKQEFTENLELAQSYGQLDSTSAGQKEEILHIVNECYERTMQTKNFGFFCKVLEAFQDKIRENVETRGKSLAQEVESYVRMHPNEMTDPENQKRMESIQEMMCAQNYTVAEDLLNRMINHEVESDIELLKDDYLRKFIEQYEYNYTKTSNSGVKLATLLQNNSNIAKNKNKNTKAAQKLLDNWLANGSNGLGEEKLSILLSCMGFAVCEVNKQPKIAGKIENYNIYLQKPENGRKISLKHPIAAFGSKAIDSGFRVVCLYGSYTADGLIETCKEIGNAKHTIILLDYALSHPERRKLARITKKEVPEKIFGVIDRVLLMYLVNNYEETSINRMLMAVMMPYTFYQPYVVESSHTMPPEIFIGRKNELAKIESPTGVNIVYGGRQLGKSALLRKAKEEVNENENGDRAVYVDIKGLDYKAAARKIADTLYEEHILAEECNTDDWHVLAKQIRRRLQTDQPVKIGYFLLLMDEADAFIESCEAVNYQPFDELKDIQNVGVERFKFVVAGLRNIVRFKRDIVLGKNNVITHMDFLTITPFSVMEAKQLLEIPLFYLGFRFSEEQCALVAMILATTNYFPGLLQLYCAKLLEAMLKSDYGGYDEYDTPAYEVKESHIKKVISEAGFQQQIREKFMITLKLDDDNYYYILALLVASLYRNHYTSEGYSVTEVIQTGRDYGVEKISALSEDKVFALMEEMRELNVLRMVDEKKYLFASYHFFEMMGTKKEIEDKLMEYMED